MTKSIEANKKYKEAKRIAKEKQRKEEMIKKEQLRLSALRDRALEEQRSHINLRYEKKLAKYIKQRELTYQKNIRKIKWKKMLKKHKKKPKTVAQLKKELFVLIQKFARLRDTEQNWFWWCISCSRLLHYTGWDWWHYISRAYMSTAFDENNINLQCKNCNGKLKWNVLRYREWLVRKIWLKWVETLEKKQYETKSWTYSELTEKIEYYTKMNQQIENQKTK